LAVWLDNKIEGSGGRSRLYRQSCILKYGVKARHKGVCATLKIAKLRLKLRPDQILDVNIFT
jgi:hypothetical protein